MTLVLTRRWQTGDTTMGTLTVDGSPLCYTLEDVVREVKIPGETAIPAGTYVVTMHQSPRFGRVPKIHDVPGFTDVLCHAGNTAKDTAGCVLVGMTRQPSAIEQSRVALNLLIPMVESAEARGEPITIEIREAFV